MLGYLLIKNYSSPMESNPEEKAATEERTIITLSMLENALASKSIQSGWVTPTCGPPVSVERLRALRNRRNKRKRAAIVFFSGVGLVFLFLLLK